MKAYENILSYKIVAILRGTKPANVIAIAEALYQGGVRLVEVTLNTPGALQSITQLSENFRDRMLIGAGTVLNDLEATQAIAAGARFIISPIVDPATIAITKQHGVVSIPGAFTATEIVQAHRLGADIIKVFPASTAQYIKDLRGPLSHIPLMPTGGINLRNIADFAVAGAVAFGIGSALVNGKAGVDDAYLQKLSLTARAFVNGVNV